MLTRALAVATLLFTLLWAAFPLCFGWRSRDDDSIATIFLEPLRRGRSEINRRTQIDVFYGDPPFLLGASVDTPTGWTRAAEVVEVSRSSYLVLQWVRNVDRSRIRLVSLDVTSAATSRLAAEGIEARPEFAGCIGSSAFQGDQDICRDVPPTYVSYPFRRETTAGPAPQVREGPPCQMLCFAALGQPNVLWREQYDEEATLLPKYALVDAHDVFIFAANPTHPYTYSVADVSLPTMTSDRTWSTALSPSEAPTSVTLLPNDRFLLNIPAGVRALNRTVGISRHEYGPWGESPWPWVTQAFWSLGTPRLVGAGSAIGAFLVIVILAFSRLRRRRALARGLIENLERVCTLDSDGTVCIDDRRVHVSLSPAQQRLVKANKGLSLSVLLDSATPVHVTSTTYRTAAALTVGARTVFRGDEEEAYRELESGSAKIVARLTLLAAAAVALLHAILFDTV